MKLLTPMLLAAGLALAGAVAPAAAYPDKPVTIIVPFPAGGATDMTARTVAPKMQEALGQPVVIDNRPGATGALGATMVSQAKPDGYTLLVASIGTYATNPFLQKGLKYDPQKDFDLLTVAVRTPNVLVVNPDFPANTVGELIEYMKQNPDKVTFASSGVGSSDHLTAALFFEQTGTKGVHVPYKGGAPAQADLMAGHVNASFQNLGAIAGHVKAGKMKPLAITSTERAKLMADVPTMAEAGFPGVQVYSWQAAAAPKGLPADVKAKLEQVIVGALKDPGVSQKFNDAGFEVVANNSDEFATFLADELAKWKGVIEKGNITVE